MMTDTPTLDKIFLLRLAFKGLDEDRAGPSRGADRGPYLSSKLHPVP